MLKPGVVYRERHPLAPFVWEVYLVVGMDGDKPVVVPLHEGNARTSFTDYAPETSEISTQEFASVEYPEIWQELRNIYDFVH